MPVEVTPPTFTLVDFDPKQLTRIVRKLAGAIGVDRPITLEVDQTTPLGAAS